MKLTGILSVAIAASLSLGEGAEQIQTNHNLRPAAADAAADAGKQGRKLQITAYYYGYDQAEKYWKDGSYKCLADDVQEFESDIRREPICEKQYKKNSDFIHKCNDGINAYIKEREDKCFAASDECEDFGEAVSDGVIATYCVMLGTTSGRKWPRSCKNTAIKECERIVNDKSSYPKGCDRPGSSTRAELAKLCEPEVEAYLSGPAPSPPSPAPSAWKTCKKISSRSECRDCCKDAEDKKDKVCDCQIFAECPRNSCLE